MTFARGLFNQRFDLRARQGFDAQHFPGERQTTEGGRDQTRAQVCVLVLDECVKDHPFLALLRPRHNLSVWIDHAATTKTQPSFLLTHHIR